MKLPQSIWWGLLPGFFTAFGGSYKDTLFEPFEPLKFFRSPLVSYGTLSLTESIKTRFCQYDGTIHC